MTCVPLSSRSRAADPATPRWWRRAALGFLVLGALVLGPVTGAGAQETLPVLARVGPWPVMSNMIGYAGRLWLVNSVIGRNHNSADIYSYDPLSGGIRYERHMFSQDSGAPLVAGGRLFWPFEDARFSMGWGEFLVTDGKRWRLGVIPSARTYHTHAMAEQGSRLIAATSAWRARLQVSEDGGRSWREIYDHPTAEGRVSRIVELVTVGDFVFGYLLNAGQRRLLRLDGETVSEVSGWPKDRTIFGLAGFRGSIYGLVRATDGVELWRSDGRRSERIGDPWNGWRPNRLAAGAEGLWAVGADKSGADASGGAVWHSHDGENWRLAYRFAGGMPEDIAVYGGQVYVSGTGDDGRGILWGPPSPAPVEPTAAPAGATILARGTPVVGDWDSVAGELDRMLSDIAAYGHHGGAVRDLAYDAARSGPPAGFFAERMRRLASDGSVPVIGDTVRVPTAEFAQWLLLWAMAVAGDGPIPLAAIDEAWRTPENTAEKYFASPPGALWAAAEAGQRDRATIAAMIGRLDAPGDPLWLRGDVVGALTVLTGERFAYDVAAWRDWWKSAAVAWPD